MMGYNSNGCRLWNPQNKIVVIAGDVHFSESSFPSKEQKVETPKPDVLIVYQRDEQEGKYIYNASVVTGEDNEEEHIRDNSNEWW